MANKILSLVLVFVFALFSFSVFTPADAQTTATFPVGCSSALGYSITNGVPCNGTNTATVGLLPGCTTALGYSTTNGVPCSGGPVAISFLAGCTATTGYSTITSEPCNGTTVASTVPDPATGTGGGTTTTPGLPSTGRGDNAVLNIVLLLVSGALAVAGVRILVRRSTSKA